MWAALQPAGIIPLGFCWYPPHPSTSALQVSRRLHLQQHLQRAIPCCPPCTAPSLTRGGSDPPDFGGKLHTCLDDEGPVRVHGHAGLPLHNESAAGTAQGPQSDLPAHPPPMAMTRTACGSRLPSAPFHQVPEQLHNPLLQHGPVLDDWVTLIGYFLLQFFQLLDLLPGL